MFFYDLIKMNRSDIQMMVLEQYRDTWLAEKMDEIKRRIPK